MLILLSGCMTEYNLATRQEEVYLHNTEKEINIGDAVARQFDAAFEINTDIDINERIGKLFERIVEVCDRKELVYTIKVVNKEDLNAVSLPGGHVYIFKGVIDAADNDDQIAGVLAHEVGHITAKHGMKRLQASYGYMVLQALAIASKSGKAVRGASVVYQSLFLAHSRQHELQADQLAVKYLKKAGFNPAEMGGFLAKLQEEKKKARIRPINYGRTHPYVNERIAIVDAAVKGKVDFKGYLNLTGNE